jgi:hypothetical protein
MRQIHYTNEPLTLDYDDEKILAVIRNYIMATTTKRFSFVQLSNYILHLYIEEKKTGNDVSVFYLKPELRPSDYGRISEALWQLIWNKEICMDFYVNPYQGQRVNDQAFIIIGKK